MNDDLIFNSLTHLGLLQVSGEQNQEFLQGQLSCDVNAITEKTSCLGVHCNAQGRVRATFYLFYLSGNYYLLLPRENIFSLLQDFQLYTQIYSIQLQDVSAQWNFCGYSGSTLLQEMQQKFGALEYWHVYRKPPYIALRLLDSIPRILVLTPKETLPFTPSLKTLTANENDWIRLDIMAGLVSISTKTREKFTPHQLNYHHQGISFTKGCYTGQEVIARMQYLGKLKNRLYRFSVSSHLLPEPATPITDVNKKQQGTLLMSAFLVNNLGYHAIASIHDMAITHSLFCNQARLEHLVIA